MSLGYQAESNVIGGGFGGFGGGWGIPPVGLFGVVGGRGFGDRDDHCCDGENRLGFDLLSQKMLENNINQNVDTRFNDVNDNLNRNALLEILGGIKSEVCDSRHDITASIGDAKFGLVGAIHGVTDNVIQNRFQGALNTKDLIASQKDCLKIA